MSDTAFGTAPSWGSVRRVDHREVDVDAAVQIVQLDVDRRLTLGVQQVDDLLEHGDQQIVVALLSEPAPASVLRGTPTRCPGSFL